jgi:hypothetical protein
MTPAQVALNDLISTMAKIAELQDKPGDLTAREDKLVSMLEDRRSSLEGTLINEVQRVLGIDYGALWFAVTPTEPVNHRS